MLVLLWQLQPDPLRIDAALLYQGRVLSEQSWEGALSYDTYDRREFEHAWFLNKAMLMGFQCFRAKAEYLAGRKNQTLLLSARNLYFARHCINTLLAFYMPDDALLPYGALRSEQLYEVRELVVSPLTPTPRSVVGPTTADRGSCHSGRPHSKIVLDDEGDDSPAKTTPQRRLDSLP